MQRRQIYERGESISKFQRLSIQIQAIVIQPQPQSLYTSDTESPKQVQIQQKVKQIFNFPHNQPLNWQTQKSLPNFSVLNNIPLQEESIKNMRKQSKQYSKEYSIEQLILFSIEQNTSSKKKPDQVSQNQFDKFKFNFHSSTQGKDLSQSASEYICIEKSVSKNMQNVQPDSSIQSLIQYAQTDFRLAAMRQRIERISLQEMKQLQIQRLRRIQEQFLQIAFKQNNQIQLEMIRQRQICFYHHNNDRRGIQNDRIASKMTGEESKTIKLLDIQINE